MTDELPAQWALDEAAKNGGWEGWEHFRRVWGFNAGPNKLCVALARYIEKHEPAPVDPDLELARECAAEYYRERGCHETAASALAGLYDNDEDVRPALLAIRKLKERGK